MLRYQREASILRHYLLGHLAANGSLRLLGVDVGMKRTGLAISDDQGRIASPLGHQNAISSPFNNRAWSSAAGAAQDVGNILHTPSFAAVYSQIREVCLARDVNAIVIGYPLLPDGRPGGACDAVIAFRAGLRRRGLRHLPMMLWDESFSSRRARYELNSVRRRVRERDGRVDGAAAAITLQSFLDSLDSSGADAFGAASLRSPPAPERDVVDFDEIGGEKAKNRARYLRRRARK
jgi:putative Holliday junction resolvase